MDKRPLIVASLCTVVLLVLGSLSNVVGYQTVQNLPQNLINERINQRELLFQTICDIANNKEIQRIILKSQISRGIVPPSEIPIVTKNQLRVMYLLGLLLSRFIHTSRMQSMIGKYQLDNLEIQKELSAVIEKDVTLNNRISQLQSSDCDCEYELPALWHFPIFCVILVFIGYIGFLMTIFGPFPTIGMYMVGTCLLLGTILDCYWLAYEIVYLS